MFDNPSRSLDSGHKRALAEVILELNGIRQVLLRAQDREFQEFLKHLGAASWARWSSAGSRRQPRQARPSCAASRSRARRAAIPARVAHISHMRLDAPRTPSLAKIPPCRFA